MKKVKLFQNKIAVKKSSLHGYGVFSEKKIKKGEIIEECYMFIANGKDNKLDNYYFEISNRKFAMFAGYGCIYNHSEAPNATYSVNVKKGIVTFKAKKNIGKGEEIFISYGDEWFSSRNLSAKSTTPKTSKLT